MKWICTLVLASGGCGGWTQREEPLWDFDEARFALEVEPILGERCSNPTCHGRPDRPLSLYSPLGWRADPADTYVAVPLTAAEEQHNFSVSCALATAGAGPDDTLLLKKPLGLHASTYHGGDTILAPGDLDYEVLRAWVADGWVAGGWRP